MSNPTDYYGLNSKGGNPNVVSKVQKNEPSLLSVHSLTKTPPRQVSEKVVSGQVLNTDEIIHLVYKNSDVLNKIIKKLDFIENYILLQPLTHIISNKEIIDVVKQDYSKILNIISKTKK